MTKQTFRNSWEINLLSSSVDSWSGKVLRDSFQKKVSKRVNHFDFKRSGRVVPFSAAACVDISLKSLSPGLEKSELKDKSKQFRSKILMSTLRCSLRNIYFTMLSTLRSTKILPGSIFPTISLPNGNDRGHLSLNSENGRDKLIFVYRGQFCPFCAGKIIKYQITSTNYTYMKETDMQHATCILYEHKNILL
jgi:hypothetical protein